MIFKIYRRQAAWSEHVKTAIIDFSKRFNAAPVLLRVNPTELDAVTEATQALKVPVPVTTNGGTLKGELELGWKE